MRHPNLLISGGTKNYWGDGSDGELITSSNVSFPSTLDGDMVVKQFTKLVINAGHLVTTTQRCKGLFIYVAGDCTINGTLSMTARGANADASAAGESVGTPGLKFRRFTVSGSDTNTSTAEVRLAQAGAAAILSESYQSPVVENGTVFTLARNAGGSGGVADGQLSGSGGAAGNGTCFSGGAGSGSGINGVGGAGGANGGAGGTFTGTGGVNGMGNPAGGTGGTIILLVRGNLVIGATGKIESNGTDADAVPSGTGGGLYGMSGGASGGGNILILFAESFQNLGSVLARGGLRNTTYNAGFSGLSGSNAGNGTIITSQIST